MQGFILFIHQKCKSTFWKSPKNLEKNLKMAFMDNGKAKEKVILPMAVLKRFDDILSPTLPKKPL
jgi:hypothetical protein